MTIGVLFLGCFATGPWTVTDGLRFRELGIGGGGGGEGYAGDHYRLPNSDLL